MAKTKEELKKLKLEYETLSAKLQELTEEELEEVCAGSITWDISVKLKENFSSSISMHGKNGKPTLPLWDEVSSGHIANPKD